MKKNNEMRLQSVGRFSIAFIIALGVLFAIATATLGAATNLMSGVVFYDGDERLSGKLVFCPQHNNSNNETNMLPDGSVSPKGLTTSSIYEFDLQRKKLNKLTDSPNGAFIPFFIPSCYGDVFCVVYQLGWRQEDNTNVFIYSKSLGLSRTVHLDSPPGMTVALSGHVFFEVGEMFHHRLIDYDIAKDSMRQILLPEASKWEIQDYDRIHVQPGKTNILHFQYTTAGKQLVEGKEYPKGFYSLDLNTGTVQPFMVGPLVVDRDDNNYWFKTFDGNCVSFYGSGGAPFDGFNLASSPWNYVGSDEIIKDDKENNIKILHKFSKLGAILKGTDEYHLIQTSPDLHYAWVKTGNGGTYYIVDVYTGKTRVLLKTDESIAMIRWVQ